MDLIIVGVDGSSTALSAARTAAALARALEARLHVITAVTRDSLDYEDAQHHVQVDVAGDAEDLAAQTAETLRSVAPQVTSAVVTGRPADALVSEAERLGADLIVVGNRRVQSSVARVMGSIATAVAHHAPCDVYIAHTSR
ncbi:universal stress protein [Aeromicrobium camelliae]|uniref:Universal stress protein n=1 Tax=Aeromicrobium camelliae TaxID=1538144 RepID=A0A3N6YGL3_9ACTN|nr:universal stress protein [Aeromicrobium camelliae]RQN08914.1 universal stress protein [Aeromicrobium camelliae]